MWKCAVSCKGAWRPGLHMDTEQDGRSAISGALDNARELLAAARALLDGSQPPRLAYHFAALALEEVGKASIVGMQYAGAARGRELPSLLSEEALQDHVRKLFWAIWGPTIGRDVITGKQIEEILRHDRLPSVLEHFG
jgi:AbiV family abortive infection protein